MVHIIKNPGSEYWIRRTKEGGEKNLFEVGRTGGNETILRMHGLIAKKIYFLMLRYPISNFLRQRHRHEGINCHGTINWLQDTVQSVPHHNDKGDHSQFETHRMSLHDAISEFGFPFIHQMIHPDIFQPSHSSLVLGMDGEIPVVFEKEGLNNAFRIVSFETSLEDYWWQLHGFFGKIL